MLFGILQRKGVIGNARCPLMRNFCNISRTVPTVTRQRKGGISGSVFPPEMQEVEQVSLYYQ